MSRQRVKLCRVGVAAMLVAFASATSADAALAQSVTTQTSAPWHLDVLGSDPLPGTYRYRESGVGVIAYVVDSGVRADHLEFGRRVQNGLPGLPGSTGYCEEHGTRVASVLGGKQNGVAKGVRLVSVRVSRAAGCRERENGVGLERGLEYIAQNHSRLFPGTRAVVNISSTPTAPNYGVAAVKALVRAGIPVIKGAGNYFQDACNFPLQSVPEVITVGGVAPGPRWFSPSDFGICVDILAPAQAIPVAVPTSATSYGIANGTSFATPIVAGAAAIILQRNPSWTPAQVRRELESRAARQVVSGVPSGTPNRLVQVGL